MYAEQYWYRSALNQVIVDDLKDIVTKALKLSKKKMGLFLDIGANDGTLLSFVPAHKFSRVGIEPAKNLIKDLKKNCDLAICKYWEDMKYQPGDTKPNIITAIGMFYDSEDPNKFIANVKENLADDGIFIAQMMAAKQMLEKNDVGNLCHEHLLYYSYRSLVYLFESNGLEIFKVEENKINGGSYRLYARHYRNGSISYRERITKRDYSAFYTRIKKNKEDCVRFVKGALKEGVTIYGYGASTKGNTILQWYGLDHRHIKGIAEIHPDKFGKLTVATHVPIYREEEADKDADYYLVLPYAFRENFIKRKKNWLKRGGKLVFCTPKFEIWQKK